MVLLPPGATSVDLPRRGLGDEDAAALAAELAVNTSVTELNLEGNRVGAAGAASLASALEKNTTLLTLDLGTNGVGAAFRASLERVKSALSSGTRLRPLYH